MRRFNKLIPYRGKFCRGKVTRFSVGDESFPRRNFSPANIFPRRNFSPAKFFPGEYYSPAKFFPRRNFSPVIFFPMNIFFFTYCTFLCLFSPFAPFLPCFYFLFLYLFVPFKQAHFEILYRTFHPHPLSRHGWEFSGVGLRWFQVGAIHKVPYVRIILVIYWPLKRILNRKTVNFIGGRMLLTYALYGWFITTYGHCFWRTYFMDGSLPHMDVCFWRTYFMDGSLPHMDVCFCRTYFMDSSLPHMDMFFNAYQKMKNWTRWKFLKFDLEGLNPWKLGGKWGM